MVNFSLLQFQTCQGAGCCSRKQVKWDRGSFLCISVSDRAVYTAVGGPPWASTGNTSISIVFSQVIQYYTYSVQCALSYNKSRIQSSKLKRLDTWYFLPLIFTDNNKIIILTSLDLSWPQSDLWGWEEGKCSLYFSGPLLQPGVPHAMSQSRFVSFLL